MADKPSTNIKRRESRTPTYNHMKYLYVGVGLGTAGVLVDWMIHFLGLAAAILFGVWAPMSYQATIDRNADNNVTQSQMLNKLDRLDELNRLDHLDVLEEMQEKIQGLAVLRAVEFCARLQSVGVRRAALVRTANPITTNPITASFSSPSPTAAPGGGANGTGRGTNPIAVALGAIFGGIALIALVVGTLYWRKKAMQK
ncbi:hypothetical protein BU26DRAFT_500760 [Trematosphaeria pertusa]|uniref:Uncharacterized protein n=1 Tax=Trematosphaeria pertusa TaxID=390896 RepID=A0A6A6IXC3_9PLEO|nr:uncharacterized protein BU26DRAFT_500760 [Trematosphaeria pertusa]KAF2255139.1 hypothetical protein BU26DRAFT_500760 [Trematosphaeria pertusa]